LLTRAHHEQTSGPTDVDCARRCQRTGTLRDSAQAEHGQVVIAGQWLSLEDGPQRYALRPCRRPVVNLVGRPLGEPLMRAVLVGPGRVRGQGPLDAAHGPVEHEPTGVFQFERFPKPLDQRQGAVSVDLAVTATDPEPRESAGEEFGGDASEPTSQEVDLDRLTTDLLLEDGDLEGERLKPGNAGTPDVVTLGDPAGNQEEGAVHPGTVRDVRGRAVRSRAGRRDVRREAPRMATGRRRLPPPAVELDRVPWAPVSPIPPLSRRSCRDVRARAQRRDQPGMQVIVGDRLTNEGMDG
jgi:hypothetical protein